MRIRERETDPLLWTLGPAGRVYLSPDFDYRIEVRRPDGALESVITRDYEHRSRSDDDKQRVRDRYGDGKDMQGVELEISEHDRDVNMLHVTDGGRLWVQNSRSAASTPLGVLARFDVFDASGRFERRLVLRADFDPEQDRFFITGERLYVLTRWADATGAWRASVRPDASYGDEEESDEEPEPMSVVCYRIPPDAFR